MCVGTQSPRMRRSTRKLLLVSLAIVVLTTLGVEIGVRVLHRVRHGKWSVVDPGNAAANSRLYVGHVWLGQMLTPGANANLPGRTIHINSRGYRGSEFPLEKPTGVRRLVCLGGSTTFDIKVSDDAHAWPAQLERLLHDSGARDVHVINAGTNGYALSRSLIDLSLRTLDLRPDWIICYPGVNDVGYADRVEYQYGECHRAVRNESAPQSYWRNWLAYSALYQEIVTVVRYRQQKKHGNWEGRAIERHDAPDARGMAALERNLQTLVGICQAHDIKLALATVRVAYDRSQPPELQLKLASADLMDHPGLSLEGHLRGYEMANELMRACAERFDLLLLDQARELPAGDAYFDDSVHFNDAGALQFAEFAASHVSSWLGEAAGPQMVSSGAAE